MAPGYAEPRAVLCGYLWLLSFVIAGAFAAKQSGWIAGKRVSHELLDTLQ